MSAEFRVCDVPDASRLPLHIRSAVAEAEAAAILQLTKAQPKAAAGMARGSALGTRLVATLAILRLAVEPPIKKRIGNAVIGFADVLPTIEFLRAADRRYAAGRKP